MPAAEHQTPALDSLTLTPSLDPAVHVQGLSSACVHNSGPSPSLTARCIQWVLIVCFLREQMHA